MKLSTGERSYCCGPSSASRCPPEAGAITQVFPSGGITRPARAFMSWAQAGCGCRRRQINFKSHQIYRAINTRGLVLCHPSLMWEGLWQEEKNVSGKYNYSGWFKTLLWLLFKMSWMSGAEPRITGDLRLLLGATEDHWCSQEHQAADLHVQSRLRNTALPLEQRYPTSGPRTGAGPWTPLNRASKYIKNKTKTYFITFITPTQRLRTLICSGEKINICELFWKLKYWCIKFIQFDFVAT